MHFRVSPSGQPKKQRVPICDGLNRCRLELMLHWKVLSLFWGPFLARPGFIHHRKKNPTSHGSGIDTD
jgi:hypothetical protein